MYQMYLLINDEWVNEMPRLNIKKSLRFEVLKRDSFTCQYCGQKAPDVSLHIDHIHPVSAGGDNDILNLVTSCKDCNSGKSDKKLSDLSVVEKKRKQLEHFQKQHHEQEMIYDWHKSLADLEKQGVDMAESIWKETIEEDSYPWDSTERQEISKLINLRGQDAVYKAIREAGLLVMRSPEVSQQKGAAISKWFWKIRTITNVQNMPFHKQKILYIGGICRNRFNYYDKTACISVVTDAFSVGVSLEWLEATSKRAVTWSDWKSAIKEEAQKRTLEGVTNGTI